MPNIDMIVTSPYVGREGHVAPGAKITVDENRARYLKQRGLATPRVKGPSETKPVGPQETKENRPGNPSGAPADGPSTDAPSSSAPGAAQPALSSVADPASALTRPMRAIARAVRGRRGSGQ